LNKKPPKIKGPAYGCGLFSISKDIRAQRQNLIKSNYSALIVQKGVFIMGIIFFKPENQPKSRQRTWRIISITVMLLVMATSAVSAGGLNLQTEAVGRLQDPLAPSLTTSLSGQAVPVEVGARNKVITGLNIEKSTNGQDADSKPGVVLSAGSAITWTYVVTNSGSEVINDIVVTDDNGTPEDTSDDILVCTINKLTNQATETCTYTGTAGAGPYGNIATATGTPASGPDVSDSDPSHYLGTIDEPAVYLNKLTDGYDADSPTGPYLTVGDTVNWSYDVYNYGNTQLTSVVVVDDNGTLGDTSDDVTVCTIPSLASGAYHQCTYSGTVAAGQYTNLGTVTASPSGGLPDVSDTDPSHYFGALPGITIEKHTNGQDADTATGPYVLVGDTVTWTYTFTNTGDVALSDVTVTDDNGTPGDTGDDVTVCTIASLDPDTSDSCTNNTVAVAGQYANLGSVTGTLPDGFSNISDSDPSHYFGAQPAITVEKHTNGQDADTAPGPSLPMGSTVSWEYNVSNSGNLPLFSVSVTDDQGVSVSCPQTMLTQGEQMTCTASSTAAAGQYANIGTATGTPPDGFSEVSDTDPSHYFGVSDPSQPALTLQKYTYGADADSAPGPAVPVGDTVTWTYTFTNTGNLTLSDVTVTDDSGTPGDAGDDVTVCTIANLNPGAADSCTDSGSATDGQYTNLGTVTGSPAGGLADVSDNDPSNYFGVSDPSQPALTLQKYTYGVDADTAPGPAVPVGDTVTWTYTFTNTGNLTLFDVTVSDDNGTPGVPGDDVTVCTIAYLHPNESDSCSDSGTAATGQYTNLGTVTGTPPGGLADVSNTDPSNYFGVSDPPQTSVVLQKHTNGQDADTAPGPYVPVGDTVTWTYTVTNTGNLTLFDILVTDDNGTPGDSGDDVEVCTLPFLNPDAADSCSANGTAAADQYGNLGTANGTPPAGLDDVSDTDPSHYFGVSEQHLELTLQKYTNGIDADTTPGIYILVGETVTWTYTVSNTGSVPLSNITITDDNGTPGNPGDDFTVCTTASLAPDQASTCIATGTATAGQFTNLGTATATPPAGLDDVSATDPSNYFGVNEQQPALTLEKQTNGQDADTAPGPYVSVGDTVTWKYTVTNIGTVPLSNVTVTDDKGTPGDTSDDFTVCTIASLALYASDSCSSSGTAAAGQYTNIGTASGTPPAGLADVSDTDPSNYFGAQPSIDIEKHTNGQDADSAPGPSIPVGDSIYWEYIVSNNGNVPLSSIEVVDDRLGSICTKDSLDVGASTTCTATGIAVLGQYKNVATVTATPPGGLNDIQDEDSSHYAGYQPGPEIELQKSTNGFDADSAPGPTLYVGYPVSWVFTVSNPGNETITDVTIVDDNGTPGDESDDVTVCSLPSLAPQTSHTCTLVGTVEFGQYANVGTASGQLDGKPVSATDPSHYLGEYPLLYLPLVSR
jgi:plastocyanin